MDHVPIEHGNDWLKLDRETMGTTERQAAEKRVAELRSQLQKASYAYYVLDNPFMADEVYDRLYRELQNLEEQHPDLVTADSPTQRVGEQPADGFTSVQHNIPLYSLENAFDGWRTSSTLGLECSLGFLGARLVLVNKI